MQQQEATSESNLKQLKAIYTPDLGPSLINYTPTSNTPIEGCPPPIVIPLKIQQEKESNIEEKVKKQA